MLGSFFSIPGLICRRSHSSYAPGDLFTKSNTREGIMPWCLGHAGGCSLHNTMTQVTCLRRVYGPTSNLRFIQGQCYLKRGKFFSVWCSARSRTNEKQLRLLDSYFGKLGDNAKVLFPLDSSDQVMQEHHRKSQSISKNGLESLDAYLGKLNNGKVYLS